MVLAFILGVLTQFKLITAGQIMLIAVLNGVVMAFDAPSRQAIVAELVGKEDLLNAIALNSAAFNSSRLIGPALAGILIASIGMSGCFYINAVSFLAVIIALLLIKVNNRQQKNAKPELVKELFTGLNFIRNHRTILILIIMVGITSLFGISYMILMPVFANDILKVGIKGLGVLMSASGLGALIAALTLARLGNFRYKGKFLVLSSLIFSLLSVLFAISKTYLLSLIILVFMGWASVTAISLINTLLQELVPDDFRGRVMSVFMFTFAGIMPFGNLIAGALAQVAGVSLTVMAGGIICTIFFLIINLFYPELYSL
jgi:predicted MFS family arabinose efflux permease